MSKLPLRSLANAIHFPSGDQAGASSQAAPVVIRVRPEPFALTIAMSKFCPHASEVAMAMRSAVRRPGGLRRPSRRLATGGCAAACPASRRPRGCGTGRRARCRTRSRRASRLHRPSPRRACTGVQRRMPRHTAVTLSAWVECESPSEVAKPPGRIVPTASDVCNPSKAVYAGKRRGLEGRIAPDSGLQLDFRGRPADDVEAVCLAEALWARAPEAGRCRDDQRTPIAAGRAPRTSAVRRPCSGGYGRRGRAPRPPPRTTAEPSRGA